MLDKVYKEVSFPDIDTKMKGVCVCARARM